MSPSDRQADFAALPAEALATVDLAALAGRTILVTGATGFVGGWLLAAIQWINERMSQPVRVHAVARRAGRRGADWLTWTACDVRELPSQARGDFIVHAALPSTSTPVGGAAALVWDAVDGTKSLLQQATRCGAERVLVLSSGAVYGGPHDRPIGERDFVGVDPTQPGSEYSMAKLATESIASVYRRETGLDVRIGRLFTCIGVGYRSHAHLAHVSLLADAIAGRPILLRSTGHAVRSYLYGADVAIWLLAMLSREGPVAMNVGSEHALTVRELARVVARAANRGDESVIVGQDPDSAPARTYFVPDTSMARRTLGLAPWTNVEDAVRRTLSQLGDS
jgi:nucleoside-diphosphate-sugar epimerase